MVPLCGLVFIMRYLQLYGIVTPMTAGMSVHFAVHPQSCLHVQLCPAVVTETLILRWLSCLVSPGLTDSVLDLVCPVSVCHDHVRVQV